MRIDAMLLLAEVPQYVLEDALENSGPSET